MRDIIERKLKLYGKYSNGQLTANLTSAAVADFAAELESEIEDYYDARVMANNYCPVCGHYSGV